ncbi:MFS transporter [Microbulbifer agarilyticus]|uniref:MFS transporter n=1 Tax=Microbulbifer agarilyticus TaxID=260552 RepID=UPI001C98B912|nr:MFS transporter [Microbulbifer agarilyticus]MBY6189556.1 MFS transporter [Microbulbifer agarilyticus]
MKTSRFLWLNLSQNTIPRHIITFYVASFLLIAMGTFAPQMFGYLFIEFLNIPESEHGRLAGDLGFWGEIALMISLLIFGPMADRRGRRVVMVIGFLLTAVGLFAFPLSDSYAGVLLARIICACGLAAITCIVVMLIGDYFSDESRGKAAGIQGFMNGLGAVFTIFLLLRLPSIFQSQGYDPIVAGTLAYAAGAALCIVAAIYMWFGLRRDWPTSAQKKQPALQQLKQGFAAAKDPAIALAYGASFVARGNLAIVGTFFALWGTNYGTQVMDLETSEALKKAANMVVIAQGTALMTAPLFGIMADKLNRVSALVVALLISALGYMATGFVSDPFSQAMMICAVFIGMGEVGCIIASGVLINERSSESLRGPIVAVFNFTGALGILIATKVGGYLFDGWRESGPFVLFGIFALMVALWALALRLRTSEPVAAPITTLESDPQA